MHKHKCSLCSTMWEHGEELDNSIPAHECPACGCHQFRTHKIRKADESRFDWPKLVQALADSSPFVRSTSIFALDVATADPQLVIPKLVEVATGDVEPMVRLAAVEALWRFGPAAASAVSAMVVILSDSRAEVRRAAALMLRNLGAAAASALPALRTAVRDPDARVRTAVSAALMKIQVDQEARKAASSNDNFTFTSNTNWW